MEETINFCNDLRQFCSRLESTCSTLKRSVQKPRINHESSLKFVLEGLEKRATSANSQVELLQSMAMETASFEELLGHCNELYKQNEQALAILECNLKESGYEIREFEMEDSSITPDPSSCVDKLFEETSLLRPLVQFEEAAKELDIQAISSSIPSLSVTDPDVSATEGRSLFLHNESPGLQDLGLSTASLAALASEEYLHVCSPEYSSLSHVRYDTEPLKKELHSCSFKGIENLNIQHAKHETVSKITGEDFVAMVSSQDANDSIKIQPSKCDYDKEPSWVRSLVSWEELNDVVGKINCLVSNRVVQGTGQTPFVLTQEDLETLGLGSKLKSYLALLLRMNQLTVEHQGGVTLYKLK